MSGDKRVIGIDVGLTSAVAACYGYDSEGKGPRLISLFHIPTVGRDGSLRIDVEALRDWLQGTDAVIAYVENATAMGNGTISAYLKASGAIEATVVLSGIHAVYVMPSVWKAAMGLDSDKKKSVRLARQLMPERAKTTFRFWYSHNEAEACLLSIYAATRVEMITLKRA